jgi:hypothetical protein
MPPTTQEQTQASAAAGRLWDGVALKTSTGDAAAQQGQSLPQLPTVMSSLLIGAPSFQGAAAELAARAVAAQLARGPARTAAVAPCYAVTPASITYTNCPFSGSTALGNASGTLNGTISRSGDVVSWNLGSAVTGVANGVNFDATLNYGGQVSFTASTIQGPAKLDMAINALGETGAFTTTVGLDLTYQTQPSLCVTGGTLEAQLVWAQRPAGAVDRAARFTWSSCGQFQVAHGT